VDTGKMPMLLLINQSVVIRRKNELKPGTVLGERVNTSSNHTLYIFDIAYPNRTKVLQLRLGVEVTLIFLIGNSIRPTEPLGLSLLDATDSFSVAGDWDYVF